MHGFHPGSALVNRASTSTLTLCLFTPHRGHVPSCKEPSRPGLPSGRPGFFRGASHGSKPCGEVVAPQVIRCGLPEICEQSRCSFSRIEPATAVQLNGALLVLQAATHGSILLISSLTLERLSRRIARLRDDPVPEGPQSDTSAPPGMASGRLRLEPGRVDGCAADVEAMPLSQPGPELEVIVSADLWAQSVSTVRGRSSSSGTDVSIYRGKHKNSW